MDLKKNELSKARVLPRLNQVLTRLKRLKCRYYPEQTDRNKYGSLGIKQSKQTEIWVLPRWNRPIYGFLPDLRDQNIGFDQNKQTKIREFVNQTEQTDGNTGIAQTKHIEAWVFIQAKQTEIRILTRPNRPKYGYKPDRNISINQTEKTKIRV